MPFTLPRFFTRSFFMSTEAEIPDEGRLACNCQFPVIFLILVVITIFVLFACVCLCCLDVTSHSPFRNQTATIRTSCAPVLNASKFVERRLSEDGGIPALAKLKYKTLNNSLSTDSCTCSVPLSRSSHSEASLISTV